MFLWSLVEDLCTKEENDKTGCNFNFGHECIIEATTHSVTNKNQYNQRNWSRLF